MSAELHPYIYLHSIEHSCLTSVQQASLFKFCRLEGINFDFKVTDIDVQ